MARPATLPGLALAVSLACADAANADDRLTLTYASFAPDDFDACEDRARRFDSRGLQGVTLVPTFYHEHYGEIRSDHTPSPGAIAACLGVLLDRGFRVVYKPHLDPVSLLSSYDRMSSDNASWRVGVTWRGLFDLDPIESGYFGLVVRPGLEMLRAVLAARPGAKPVRFELGSELMHSTARRPESWVEVARRARSFLVDHDLVGRVLLSHNFSHHVQIDEDVLAPMRDEEKRKLGEYVASLDEVAVSQYMDLTLFAPDQGPTPESVAQALAFYHRRFREVVLRRELGVERWNVMPVHVGEFGIGAGGLKHPNYHRGAEPEAMEQEIGMSGLLLFLDETAALPPEQGLTATLWTIGSAYDVFGFFDRKTTNPGAASRLAEYLSRE